MAESIVEIILRIKADTEKVVAKTMEDFKALKAAAADISSPGTSKVSEDLAKIANTTTGAVSGVEKLATGLTTAVTPATTASEAVAKVAAESAKASLAMSEAGVSALKVGADAGQGAKGLREADAAGAGLTSTFGGLLAVTRPLISAFVGLFAVSKLKGLADIGAQIQVTGTVLRVVANNAGIAGGTITALDKEIQGLGITAKDSGQALTTFIQAGLAGIKGESLGKAKELARAAQDLAVVSGQNSSETFNRLITNIQQMDTMGLRFMGIMVDRERSEARYAQSLGKSASELTEVEKKQAFLNATLIEAAKQTGTYEEAMGDAAKQLTSIPRLVNEIAAPISETLQPAYSALIVTFSEFLKETKKLATEWRESTDGGLALGDAVKSVATIIKDSVVWLLKHYDTILLVVKAWVAFRAVLIAGTVLTGLATAWGALTAAVTLYRSAVLASFPAMVAFQAVAASSTGAVSALSGALASIMGVFASIRTAVAATAVAFTTAGGGIAGALTAIRVGLVGVLTALGPVGIALAVLGAAWALFSSTKTSKSDKEADVLENRKALATMVGDTVAARAKMLEARRLANVGSDDPNTQKRLEALAKEAEGEYKIAKAKQDRFAKEKGESKEAIRLLDEQKQGEYAISQAIASVTQQTDALRIARQKLGITDKDGKTADDNYDDSLKAFDNVFNTARAKMVQVAETSEQMMDRVVSSGAETIVSLATKATAAGLSVEGYIEKFYPPPQLQDRWAGLQEALKQGGDTAKKAFSEINAGFERLLSDAKSPEQMANALNSVGKYAEILGARVTAAKETLKFNQEKAEIDRLNQALVGFSAQLTALRSGMETVSMLSKDSADSQRKWDEVVLSLGGSFNKFGQAVSSSGQAMALFSSTTGQIATSQAQASQASLLAATTRYQQEEALLAGSNAKKRAIAAELPGDEKAQAIRVEAINKESLDKRIENAKQHYATLKTLRDEALSGFKAYADKVKDLDKAIAASKESKESDLRNIRRKGMSEEEQNQDKLLEYNELLAKSKEAVQSKAYDKAKEYADKARELAKGIEGVDLAQQAEMVGAAWDVSIAAQEQQKEESKKAAAEMLAAYEKVSTSVKELADSLGKLTGEQTTKVLVDIDQTSLESAIQKVMTAFEALDIKVKVSAQTTVDGSYATGGMIDGPGTETSDSIIAAVSKNEFITMAQAVRHYGSDLFYALNSMRIPRETIRNALSGGLNFLSRGMSSLAPQGLPRFATGGLVMGSSMAPVTPESVELNLTFNSRPVGRVAGSRDSIHNLVSVLREVSRGT